MTKAEVRAHLVTLLEAQNAAEAAVRRVLIELDLHSREGLNAALNEIGAGFDNAVRNIQDLWTDD